MQQTQWRQIKSFLYVLLLIGGLTAIGMMIFALSFATLVKTGVEKMAPQILGVPATLEDVDLSLLGGSVIQVDLKQLTIDNPKGYETAHAISLPHVRVLVNWMSLLGETVVIKDVLIEKPLVTFERLNLGNNLRDIQNNVTRNTRSDLDDGPAGAHEDDDEDEDEDEDWEESETRVHIERVMLKGAEANVSLLWGKRGVMRLPLPDLELHDIGKASGGASLREASSQIFSAVYKAVFKSVTQPGELIPEGIRQLIDAAKNLGKTAGKTGEALEDAGKKLLKGLFRQ